MKILKTKKLTEASMLSALFIITSVIAIYTGLAYSIYLDIVVPIFVTLIYIRLGTKYTVLSSLSSLLIVVFSIGDIVSAIWMSQGILIGFIVGYFINKEGALLDDFFYSSILGCFVMILVDIYFSKLTGYSFIRDFKEYATMFSIAEDLIKPFFYVFVAMIPMGTVFVVYFISLLLGKRLNILNNFSKEKYKVIKNYKKVGSYLCCSKNTFTFATIYLFIIEFLNYKDFIIGPIYIVTVVMSIRVVAIYFVLKDAFSFVTKWIYTKINSKTISQMLWFLIIYVLLVDFKTTTIILIFTSIILNFNLHIREKQIVILNKFLRVNGN